MSYVHIGPPKELREPFGKQLSGIRVVVDYNEDEAVVDRYAAILEIKDYSQGGTDTITINPSDAGSTTWTEGSDFSASSNNETTANNITSAINGTADYVAKAVTGHDGNPFVYITYAGGGHIDSASSGDTSAWAFYEVNTSNGTVAATHSDRSGTIKKQPLY